MLFKQFALFLLATSSTWPPMWRKNGRHSHVVRRQLVALAQEQRNVRIDLSKKEVSSFAGDSITGNVVDGGDPNSKNKVGRDDGETVLNRSGSFVLTGPWVGPNDGMTSEDHTVSDLHPVSFDTADPMAGLNDRTISGGGPSSKGKGKSDDHTVLDFNPVVNDRPRQLVVTRKVDKTSKKSAPTSSKMVDIEGTYMYSGCNYRIFQLKITCGLFGPNDRDLCLYEEYSIGTLVQDATDETLEIEEGMFLLPDAVTQEGGIVDHNEVCVLSGTFRFSSIQGGRDILPIPLASSNGCKRTTENFKFVVKARVMNDGNLDLSFSNDLGVTYKEIPSEKAYVGNKIFDEDRRLDEIVGEHRHLVLCDDLVPCDDAPVGISSVGQSCYTTNIPLTVEPNAMQPNARTSCQDDSECCDKEAKCVRSVFARPYWPRVEYGTCIIPDQCRRNLGDGLNGMLTCGDNALSSNFNQKCCDDPLSGTPQECIRIRGTTDGTAGQIRCAPVCEITDANSLFCAQGWGQANLNLATCGLDRACCDVSVSQSKWKLDSDGDMCLAANCLRNAGGCPPFANGWLNTICDGDEACCNGAVQQRDWKVREPEAKCTPAPTPAPVPRPPTDPNAPPPPACTANDCDCAPAGGLCRSFANPFLGTVACPGEQRYGGGAQGGWSCNCADAQLTYRNC